MIVSINTLEVLNTIGQQIKFINMDRNLERQAEYARDGINALVQEIERLESEVQDLQDIVSAKESEIEVLEDTIYDLKQTINDNGSN